MARNWANYIDTYLREVDDSSCDPGARRALQILYGLGACAGGDALLMDLADHIAREWTGFDPDFHDAIIIV